MEMLKNMIEKVNYYLKVNMLKAKDGLVKVKNIKNMDIIMNQYLKENI